MRVLRAIHRYWVVLLFLAVVVQIGAAGYGAFNAAAKSDPGPLSEDQFSQGFDVHNGFGYTIFLATIILSLLAVGARVGRRRLVMTFVLLLLLVVQILLAWAGEDHPVAGIFHPLNAFLILGLTGRLAYEAWWGAPSADPRAAV